MKISREETRKNTKKTKNISFLIHVCSCLFVADFF